MKWGSEWAALILIGDNSIPTFAIAMVSLSFWVLLSLVKRRKSLKVGYTAPDFGFLGDFVVIVREGCGCFGGARYLIYNCERKLRWYIGLYEGFNRFLVKR